MDTLLRQTMVNSTVCLFLYPLVNDNPNFSIYMFNIEQLNERKAVKDARIELTIRYAFSKFFEDNQDAIIVVLDSMDDKHYARKRLFNQWFKNANVAHIEKIEVVSNTDEIEIIASLFVEKSNPYYSEIKSSFAELVKLNFYS